MPLVVLVGIPCSGKTRRAYELKQFFEGRGKQVDIVSEEEVIKKLGYEKNATYLDAQKEKRVRGMLKSEVMRLIGKDNLVILDGSNYIKGFRYELYCASKASKCTQCTIYTIRNHEEAAEANRERLRQFEREGDSKDDVKDNDGPCKDAELVKDKESPCKDAELVRDKESPWEDAELVRDKERPCEDAELVRDKDGPCEVAESVRDKDSPCEDVEQSQQHGTSKDDITWKQTPYTDEVFLALTKFRFEEPNSQHRWDSPLFTVQPDERLDTDTLHQVLFLKKPPPPNMSTQNPPLCSTNCLYDLDRMTQAVNAQILEAKRTSSSRLALYPDCAVPPALLECATPQKLLAYRRQFLTFARQQAADPALVTPRYYTGYLGTLLRE